MSKKPYFSLLKICYYSYLLNYLNVYQDNWCDAGSEQNSSVDSSIAEITWNCIANYNLTIITKTVIIIPKLTYLDIIVTAEHKTIATEHMFFTLLLQSNPFKRTTQARNKDTV